MPKNRLRIHSGFTLIELLVVLAVIAIFIGVFASALRPGSPTVAVEGAQAQLASLITQARGVATSRGAEARLVVNADPGNPDRYLRYAGIVYNDPDEGWVAATDGVSFPSGVFVVPPTDPSVVEGVNWDSRLNSSFSDSSSAMSLQYISNEAEDYYYIEFTDRGLVPQTPGSPTLISVSVAQPGADGSGLEFTTPGATRGAILRQYGSFVLLNEPNAYPD